jgi:hypothetical protein
VHEGTAFGAILRRPSATGRAYLSCVDTLPKVVFNLAPMPLTEAMMPTPIAAEIRQYSIAVAPD